MNPEARAPRSICNIPAARNFLHHPSLCLIDHPTTTEPNFRTPHAIACPDSNSPIQEPTQLSFNFDALNRRGASSADHAPGSRETMANECVICCEAYTAVVRKKVECGHCQEACCAPCFQKYLLSLQGDPHCMSCKRAFDREFLSMHLSRTWLLSVYKQHRERVLLEREMALLPATQDALQNYKHCMRLEDELRQLDETRHALLQDVYRLNYRATAMRRSIDTMRASNYATRPETPAAAVAPTTERRQFVRACPVDGCRGFLSTAWKCGTCETRVCKDCGEPRDEAHRCDPDVAASHALMQKDSRPCPKCASMIHKVDGCSQIWCTQCHVAFDWHTGKVVTNGIIHNPHYYEWLRRTRGQVPRNPGDVPCGGLPGIHDVDALLRRTAAAVDKARVVRNVHRVVRHLQGVDIPNLRRDARNGHDRNLDLRLAYLMHKLDGDEWRKKLQQREKRRERAAATLQVYDMFCAAATDMFRNMVGGGSSPSDTADDLTRLSEFADQSLDSISRRFNMRVKRMRFM